MGGVAVAAKQPSGDISARYGPAAAAEWDLVLSHFDLAEGFSLLILAVPDRDGADLCRRLLEAYLASRCKRVEGVTPQHPEDLKGLAKTLVDGMGGEATGATWIAAVPPTSAPDHQDWAAAWRYALASLNQHRNPLRRQYDHPLVFVVAPWVVPLFRDVAPDLWSVRDLVVRIEPSREPGGETTPRKQRAERSRRVSGKGPDVAMALRQVERLRGRPGKERQLAEMLERTAWGLAASGDQAVAEKRFREAADLQLRYGTPTDAGRVLHNLAWAIFNQGRSAEAEKIFHQALALGEQGGDTPIGRGTTRQELGRSVLAQGRASEAEEVFRRVVALCEQGGDTPTNLGTTVHELGCSILAQGRAAEAEDVFRRALALGEQGGDTPASLAITLEELAQSVLDQGRTTEAEEIFRRAAAMTEPPPTE